MSTDTLIRNAHNAGVELRFVDGQLKVIGHRKAVESWAPQLRRHKTELIEALRILEPEVDWKELAVEYNSHHFACPTCQAAGRGAGYGLRCGTGAALWTAYQTPNADMHITKRSTT